MIRREDNPGLFDAIRDAYNNIANLPSDERIKENAQEIDSEKLEKITVLDISPDYDVKNIKGIENLVNLESFGIYGSRGIDLKQMVEDLVKQAEEKAAATGNPNINYKSIENKIKLEYEKNQITDFSPLKQCDNLKGLYVYSQRDIKEINMSAWQNLKDIEIMDCGKLEYINGLDNLDVKKDDRARLIVDYCSRLKFLPGLQNYVMRLEGSQEDSRIVLPINTYFLMSNTDKSLRKDKVMQNSKKVYWIDEEYSITTLQAELAKTRVEEILSTICKDRDNNLVKLSRIYRWICENVVFNEEGSELEDNLLNGNIQNVPEGYQDFITALLRSVYFVLWSKTGVCKAVAGLLNLFCAELGIVAEKVHCNGDMQTPIRDAINFDFDHTLSKVLLNVKGKNYFYYFDPTYDLYRKEYNNKKSYFFCLNHKEAAKHRNFGISEINMGGGPSLQNFLDKRGLLETGDAHQSWTGAIKQKQLKHREKVLVKKHEKLGLANPYKDFQEVNNL